MAKNNYKGVWSNVNKQRRFLIITAIVIVLGYIFFFTSPYIFNTSRVNKDDLSPVGEPISFANGKTVTIDTWDYCPTSNAMEVKLFITDNAYDGKNKYDFAVGVFKGNAKNIQVQQIVSDLDLIVLVIRNLPEEFDAVLLRMYNEGDEHKNDNFLINLYAQEASVHRVETLPAKTSNEYRAEVIDERISTLNASIDEVTAKMKENKDTITGLNQQIAELQTRKHNSTDVELENINDKIETIQQKKKELNSENSSLKDDIKEYNKQIYQYKNQKKKYLEQNQL